MSEGRWQLQVDRDLCIGSGMCAGTAPDHFELVDGLSRPTSEDIEPTDTVLDAAESCPVEAIILRERETGKVLAPGE